MAVTESVAVTVTVTETETESVTVTGAVAVTVIRDRDRGRVDRACDTDPGSHPTPPPTQRAFQAFYVPVLTGTMISSVRRTRRGSIGRRPNDFECPKDTKRLYWP